MGTITPNPLKEEFARFFEYPSRDGLRNVLKNNLGESAYLEFKRQWPEDFKLAKHVLAIANCGGGCIVIGVDEADNSSLVPVGLELLREKSKVDQGLRRYVPENLAINLLVMDFGYQESEYPRLKGKSFQAVFIPDLPGDIPFLSTKEIDRFQPNTIFVRRMASTEEANYEELQRIISRRIETQHSSSPALNLSKHLIELRLLHEELDHFHLQYRHGNPIALMLLARPTVTIDGADVSVEAYEDFLAIEIIAKQEKITKLLRS